MEHARAMVQLGVVLADVGRAAEARAARETGTELLTQLGATPWLATAAL